MKKLILSLSVLFASALATTGAKAQAGSVGLGLRLSPDGAGGTVKYFFDQNLAIEGQLNAGGLTAYRGTSVYAVGLIEYHIYLPKPEWRLFFGGGAHLGSWDRDYYYHGEYRGKEFMFGIDGIGGVEYVFKNIPLGLSGDFKPAINFLPDAEFFPHNIIGASARFYFGRTAPKHHR